MADDDSDNAVEGDRTADLRFLLWAFPTRAPCRTSEATANSSSNAFIIHPTKAFTQSPLSSSVSCVVGPGLVQRFSNACLG